MKTLTIFTPTYNRAHLLSRLYQSLREQTSNDFEWLVIDDGSTDNTRELIAGFQQEKQISLKYVYKDNGGMHTAHNVAFENTVTPLVMCCDSDDIMDKMAVAKIVEKWKEVVEKREETKYAGIIANCAVMATGAILGSDFPMHLQAITFYDVYYKYHVVGDKLLAYRSNLIKQTSPYPSFPGEKFTPLDIKYLEIKQPLIVLHDKLMVKEYQAEGYTNNIPIVYTKNPQAFVYYHIFRMRRVTKLFVRIKSVIHYIACSHLTGQKRIVQDSPLPTLTALLYPLGCIWYYKLLMIKKKIQGRSFSQL